jgi:hypothetical protein
VEGWDLDRQGAGETSYRARSRAMADPLPPSSPATCRWPGRWTYLIRWLGRWTSLIRWLGRWTSLIRWLGRWTSLIPPPGSWEGDTPDSVPPDPPQPVDGRVGGLPFLPLGLYERDMPAPGDAGSPAFADGYVGLRRLVRRASQTGSPGSLGRVGGARSAGARRLCRSSRGVSKGESGRRSGRSTWVMVRWLRRSAIPVPWALREPRPPGPSPEGDPQNRFLARRQRGRRISVSI